MVTWCTRTSGTNLNAYDFIRWINNGMRTACLEFLDALRITGKYIYLVLPGWVIPVIENNEVPITEMPAKKFWAVRISIGGLEVAELPLPKQSIDDMWHAVIAPIDYYIPNSEYWPYLVDGEIVQGISQTPNLKFGLWQNLPSIAARIGIVVAIVAVLEKVGLFKLAGKFFTALSTYYKQRKLYHEINDIEDAVEHVTSDVATLTDVTSNGLRSIDSKIGVRLILR